MTTASGLGEWDLDNPDLYLNPNETDLLINALNSNKPDGNTHTQTSNLNRSTNSNPYLEFDTSTSFDWDLKGMSTDPVNYTGYPPTSDRRSDGGSDDGSQEGSPEYDDGEVGDKRKADSPDGEDGPGKRQETGKKTQKPGRKPLTSEPTTKRKAQNRAAQRAFRERKEKHLKDLEDKVDELQKKSDNTDSENAQLKAQVSRLQTELNEYRKRLSSSALPTTFASSNSLARNSWDTSNNFNFEFPKFGSNNEKGNRSLSSGYNKAPMSPVSPVRSGSQSILNNTELQSLFSADVLSNAERASNENSASRSNSTNQPFSPSNTASPASSGFPGFTSSCVTTPESTADTPEARKSSDAGSKTLDQKAFCKEFQTSCGTTQNPVPQNPVPQQTRSMSNDIPALTPGAMTTTSTEASLDLGSFDWLANQNGGEFNPALFGDYREPQESIMNNDGWFFNDAFALPDFGGSPLTQTNSQTMPKKTFMQEIEDTQSGKEPEVVPGEAPQEFLTCNLLWDRVQKSQKVLSGEADMDDLCSQLKSKAKCSGSGAVISQNDVDAILGPISTKEVEPNYLNMFK